MIEVLEEVLADTQLQENTARRSRVLGYLVSIILKALETGEIEDRVAALERAQGEDASEKVLPRWTGGRIRRLEEIQREHVKRGKQAAETPRWTASLVRLPGEDMPPKAEEREQGEAD